MYSGRAAGRSDIASGIKAGGIEPGVQVLLDAWVTLKLGGEWSATHIMKQASGNAVKSRAGCGH